MDVDMAKEEDSLRKGQNVALWKTLLAGAVSGLLARSVTAPMDTIKIRLQLTPANGLKPLGSQVMKVAGSMIKNEGIRAFWKGNVPGSLLYVTYGSAQFGSYALFNRYLAPFGLEARLHSLVVGALAGTASSFLSYPFDVLRTRLVANNQMQSISIGREVHDIWKLEGLAGFFKGSIASMATITVTASVMFGTYETIRIYCDENEKTTTAGKKWELAALNHSAGAIGGVIAKITTFPLETIRRRMQFMNSRHVEKFSKHSAVYSSYKGYGFARIGLEIVKQEGVSSLYRGILVALSKTIPTAFVSFWGYETAIHYLRLY
ncbi:Tpc1p [Saccharomyces cerevisiae x Saccharomyces kudriavzevii VIN7]|uniref:Tpc1p n=1 Tax=Saccharomyces cerevisiae x Saccharomyces kudriavzevii (strain VIN7) TaxID=1095631 RepID=H0GV45_SACCK|nr:Tpc1p [Saccharomyces cerevisiae x Saccharomyces kudriavzevii VIN7]CAI5273232.1 AIS_HP2_G0019780.mRNA.1.CDS.1 [Saccharomyces cerevisiae]CAI6521333.1 AIS_HP2_G0019780.mRNA.1.CDS.1 [Saccharomyces cerevisiae]